MDLMPNQLSNLTQYVDNKLSMDKHKINLTKIYNRTYEEANKSLSKSNEFYQRVQNNKIFAKRNNKCEEQYYIDKVNNIIRRKLGSIHDRPNLSSKINPYYSITARNHKVNIAKCQQISKEKIKNENLVFGIRLKSRPPYISASSLEKAYLKVKEVKERQKCINIPNLQKLSQRLISQSPVHQQMLEYKKLQGKLIIIRVPDFALPTIPKRVKQAADSDLNIQTERNITKESERTDVSKPN